MQLPYWRCRMSDMPMLYTGSQYWDSSRYFGWRELGCESAYQLYSPSNSLFDCQGSVRLE